MKKHTEFSKILLLQESVLVWITTLVCLGFGYLCIIRGYLGSLPWVSSIIASCYAAYAVSQAFYYKKAQTENSVGGIKYETTLQQLKEYIPEETVIQSYTSDDDDMYKI